MYECAEFDDEGERRNGRGRERTGVGGRRTKNDMVRIRCQTTRW